MKRVGLVLPATTPQGGGGEGGKGRGRRGVKRGEGEECGWCGAGEENL